MKKIVIQCTLFTTQDWQEYKDELVRLFKKNLKKERLYREDAIYRGFNYNNFKKLEKYGTDTPKAEQGGRKFIWAGTENLEYYDFNMIFQYAKFKRSTGLLSFIKRESNQFGIACYNPEYFEEITPKGQCFLKGDKTFKEALFAIVIFIPEK